MTEQATADETAGRLRQLAEKHYARGVEIRHHLHPELSGQEIKTARYVAEILRECGIETQIGIGENGVLGVIRGGKPGKAGLLVAAMALSELRDEIPEGQVTVRAGAAMAAPDEFRAVLKGRARRTPESDGRPHSRGGGSRYAVPDYRESSPDTVDPAVVSVCMIRTFSAELREMERILRGVALGAGGSHELTVTRCCPPLINDTAATALARSAFAKIVGTDNVLDSSALSMGGEDFAYIAEQVSASFFFVGIMQGTVPAAHHSPGFCWEDRALKTVSARMAQVALDFLRSA